MRIAFLDDFALPDAEQVRLLRACLPVTDGRLPAAELEWAFAQIGRADAGLRWLLPLLAMRHDADGDHMLTPKLKAARLYEARRRQRFEAIAADAIARITERGRPPILSRGAALSLSAYPAPEARHLHDLDLIVEDVGAAGSALLAAGYEAAPEGSGRLRHASGMGIALHASPLSVQDTSLTRDTLAREARHGAFGGTPVLVPPDDLVLLHVLLLPSTRAATGLTWAADGWMAVRQGLPDWLRLASLQGPDAFWTRRALRFLACALDAPVPPAVLDQLTLTVRRLGPVARLRLLTRATRLRGRRALVRHVGRALLPPPERPR